MASSFLMGQGSSLLGNIGGNVLGAMGAIKGAREASKQIKQGMQDSTDYTNRMSTEQANLQQPWMQAGTSALGDLQSFRMREASPYQASQFQGVNLQEDPSYQFRMDQGRKALDASATNQGSLFSGAQQKELLKYGQDLASQEYGNAYNRQYGQFKDAEDAKRNQFNTEADRTINYDQFRMNQLQNLTGIGQNATNSLAGAKMNLGSQDLQNQLLLMGNLADINAGRARAPWMAGSNIAQSTGNTGANIADYYMKK